MGTNGTAANTRAYRSRKRSQGWVNLTILVRAEHLAALDLERVRRRHANRHETLAEVLERSLDTSAIPMSAGLDAGRRS